MASPIDQMLAIASQIKEATKRGENTASKVGGLLVDIIEYLSILRVDDVELGPFLTALKNSELLDPVDGQTLAFSVLEDKWTFSSAITQLKLSQNHIEEAVASNYTALQETKSLLQGELQQVASQMDDKYDSLVTWRDQTDSYIGQYATAYDEEGNLVSMSSIFQTTEDVTQHVEKLESELIDLANYDAWEQGNTQNEEAGKTYEETKVNDSKCLRMKNMLPVTKNSYITFIPNDSRFSLCLLYFNQERTYSNSTQWSRGWVDLDSEEAKEGRLKITDDADVQFVAIKLKRKNGDNITVEEDIKESSLAIVNNKVATSSEVKQTADSIMSVVSSNKEAADEAFKNIDEVVIPGLNGRLDDVEEESGNSASWISQNKDRILLISAQFDEEGNLTNTSGLVTTAGFSELFAQEVDSEGIAHSADLGVFVEKDQNGKIVTGISLDADQINMTSSVFEGWFRDATIHSEDITFDADTLRMISDNVSLKASQLSFEGDDSFDWTITSEGVTIFHLDHNGNLEIAGQLKQCQIIDNVTVGESSKKIVIEPDNSGAKLVGYNDNVEVFSLGFNTYGDSVKPGLNLGSSSITDTNGQFYRSDGMGHLSTIEYRLWDNLSELHLYNHENGNYVTNLRMATDNGKVIIAAYDYGGDNHKWPTSSQSVPIGGLFVDQGYLKVRTS